MPLEFEDLSPDARAKLAADLGLVEPDAADDDTEESAAVDTRSSNSYADAVDHIAERPIHPPTLIKPYAPPSRAYGIVDAALRLSGALNGAPVVERTPEGYTITLLPRLRLSYTAHELAATVITWEVRDSSGWRILSRQRLPKLSHEETGRILVWFWLGEDHG